MDAEWEKAEKAVDPNFKGSIFEQMGFEDKLCPTCKAHLKSGICLNACHLGKSAQERFAALMKASSGKTGV